MGSSSQPSTSTTTVQNPGQDKLINLGIPFLQQFAANPPNLPSAGTVAPFDPAQTAGQEDILGAAAPGGSQQTLANTAAGGANFLGSGAALDPSTNPALQDTINAATLPIQQNLTESTLPAVRSAATQTGQFGSSRQGIAEGLAAGRASQAEGATAAGIANQGYQSGLDAMIKNLALIPQTQQAQLAPGLATSGVGDVRQSMSQQLLGEKNLYEQYPQLLPLLLGQSFIGTGAAIPAQGSTTTGTSSGGNTGLQAAGLGIQGLGMLLPFLGSDRRMKKDIRLVGHLRNGTPVFRFKYKSGTVDQLGFMADSVPPCCVVDVLGFSVVNYQRVLELAGA